MTCPIHSAIATPYIRNSINRSSLGLRFLRSLVAVTLTCFSFSQIAAAGTEGGLGAFGTSTTEGFYALNNLDSTDFHYDTGLGYQALFSVTTGNKNTAIGANALLDNVVGNDNTATGFQALYYNTASSNTATGSLALFNNTTGENNTATGFRALSSNTNGSDNTGIGYNALHNNAFDAIDNTAVGSGALSSNVSSSFNTAIGFNALLKNTAGSNTAVGDQALLNNTGGSENTAIGTGTLFKNVSGHNNTASGLEALFSNTTGSNNTADGLLALENNINGHDNVAEGFEALATNTSGSFNIALGSGAGMNLTAGSNNIDIGNPGIAGESGKIHIGKQGIQNRTFIAGIRGITTVNANAIPVVIDSAGQLGTVSSSRRFKQEIRPMDKTSETILRLKPVTFHYKSDSTATPQYGLIAEDVAKVNPDLVVRDEDGEIYTVRYDAVNAMLLNEFLKEHRRTQEVEKDLRSTIARQQKQIEALTAVVQKVSDEVERPRAVPVVVANNH